MKAIRIFGAWILRRIRPLFRMNIMLFLGMWIFGFVISFFASYHFYKDTFIVESDNDYQEAFIPQEDDYIIPTLEWYSDAIPIWEASLIRGFGLASITIFLGRLLKLLRDEHKSSQNSAKIKIKTAYINGKSFLVMWAVIFCIHFCYSNKSYRGKFVPDNSGRMIPILETDIITINPFWEAVIIGFSVSCIALLFSYLLKDHESMNRWP